MLFLAEFEHSQSVDQSETFDFSPGIITTEIELRYLSSKWSYTKKITCETYTFSCCQNKMNGSWIIENAKELI